MGNETERPCIEFDGQRYQRQKGAWYDQRYVRAHDHLSQRIDTCAKDDAALWQQCQRQDRLDDPKNRGARRSLVGENVKISWNRGRELVVRCDIEPGWRKTARVWYFNESDRIELPSGQLRVSTKFEEHTFGQWRRRTTCDGATARTALNQLDSLPPSFTQAEYEINQNIRFKVEGSACNFVINWPDTADELNSALPWERDGRRRIFKGHYSGLYEQPIRLVGRIFADARPFYIEIKAVLHDPRQTNPAPEYVAKTPFASGGLPSLGKKR